jgi:hypothetical protein
MTIIKNFYENDNNQPIPYIILCRVEVTGKGGFFCEGWLLALN